MILPAQYKGSPRWYAEQFQNALAIAYALGMPSIFITMTCNDNWIEIKEAIEKNQNVKHRADIRNRVFKMKLDELIHNLKKKEIFGACIGYFHVIEFQKRGRPHAHVLVILAKDSKLYTTDDYDNIVCAEIPDPIKHPVLHKLVLEHMIHIPCSYDITKKFQKRCIDPVTKNCTKYFPFQFTDNTYVAENGVIYYRRRAPENGGFIGKKNDKHIDNKWVVPYNPYLLKKYQCHLNVIIPNQLRTIKYLYDYLCKGSDQAAFWIEAINKFPQNELKRFIHARYIAAPEACWRIFGFPFIKQQHQYINYHCIYLMLNE